MGLLDDAIREHLELKRRRGADPDEVARQENEALGDPRAPVPEDTDAPLAGPDVTAVTPPAAEEEPLAELDEPEAAGPPTEHDPDDDEPEAPSAVAAPPEPEPWLADEPAPVEPARPERSTGPRTLVNSISALPSVWRIQIGVKFQF